MYRSRTSEQTSIFFDLDKLKNFFPAHNAARICSSGIPWFLTASKYYKEYTTNTDRKWKPYGRKIQPDQIHISVLSILCLRTKTFTFLQACRIWFARAFLFWGSVLVASVKSLRTKITSQPPQERNRADRTGISIDSDVLCQVVSDEPMKKMCVHNYEP